MAYNYGWERGAPWKEERQGPVATAHVLLRRWQGRIEEQMTLSPLPPSGLAQEIAYSLELF